MAKRISSNFDSSSVLAPLLLILYLLIGFIPNWQAVDKIAPQWLMMSALNLISLIYFINNRNSLAQIIGLNIKSKLVVPFFANLNQMKKKQLKKKLMKRLKKEQMISKLSRNNHPMVLIST